MRAAIDVVADRGLRGLTFRAVGDAAGVNNALIAHHFGNREGLLVASLQWTVEQLIELTALTEAMTRPFTYRDALDRAANTDRKLIVFQYELILESSRNTRFRQPVADLYRAYFRSFAPDAPTDDALTRARFAACDGLVLQMVSGAITHEQFEASIDALFTRIALDEQ